MIKLTLNEMWAIGLFEGEGSIVTPTGRGRSSVLIIQMCDEDVLRKFNSIVGVGHISGPYNYNKNKNVRYKSVWKWSTAKRDDVRKLLTRWLPFLGERRKVRAISALKRLDQPTKKPGPKPKYERT